MSWQNERAQLIADTLEMLRQFTKTRRPEPGTPFDPQDIQILGDYVCARVATFRTRRQLLQLEREVSFELELRRLRTHTQQWARPA
jgi:hypothetical protein